MGNRLMQAIRTIREMLARMQARHVALQEARREMFEDQFNQAPPWLLYYPFIFNLHQALLAVTLWVVGYYIWKNFLPRDDDDEDED